MYIELPKSFTYADKSHRSFAYVKKGTLYIEGKVDFETLMYNITYVLHGYNRCGYCGRTLNNKNRTLDHKFPRTYGGVSIPNNLIPCCKRCNKQKKDMTFHQYIKYLKCQSEQERQNQYDKSIAVNMKRVDEGDLVLPKSWIVQYDVKKIFKQVDMKWLDKLCKKRGDVYVKERAKASPILLSSNGYMFKGVYTLYYAYKNKLEKVPAVVLDNVINVW